MDSRFGRSREAFDRARALVDEAAHGDGMSAPLWQALDAVLRVYEEFIYETAAIIEREQHKLSSLPVLEVDLGLLKDLMEKSRKPKRASSSTEEASSRKEKEGYL